MAIRKTCVSSEASYSCSPGSMPVDTSGSYWHMWQAGPYLFFFQMQIALLERIRIAAEEYECSL